MEKKNKDRNPIYYKNIEEIDKPLSELIENLRTDLVNVRGKLFDIKQTYGWEDRIEHLEGGLTCMLVAMHGTMEEWKKFEQKEKMKLTEKEIVINVFSTQGIDVQILPVTKREYNEENIFFEIENSLHAKALIPAGQVAHIYLLKDECELKINHPDLKCRDLVLFNSIGSFECQRMFEVQDVYPIEGGVCARLSKVKKFKN